jgi:hypothetical protein
MRDRHYQWGVVRDNVISLLVFEDNEPESTYRHVSTNEWDLSIFLRNIAMAGALTVSFRLGFRQPSWRPNAEGVAAP